jgi:C4-dicarboxylate-specific signal transduction histidine kinase
VKVRIAHIYATALAEENGLSALEVLAAGLAHELNNPLSIVLSNLAFALEQMAGGDLREVAPALRDAKEATERLASFLREIDVGRATGRSPTSVSVDGALRRAVEIAGPLAEGRASLLLELTPTPPVNGPEAHLVLAFSVLIADALQGVPLHAPGLASLRLRSAPRGDDVLVELWGREDGPTAPGSPAPGPSLCSAIVTSLGGTVEAAPPGAGGPGIRISLPSARSCAPVLGLEPG